MLIRHNERTGTRQPQTYAHDTEQPDTQGCYQSGIAERVITTAAQPCKCGGYGALVAIRSVSRDEYPAGSEVPLSFRLHDTEQPEQQPDPQPEQPQVTQPAQPEQQPHKPAGSRLAELLEELGQYLTPDVAAVRDELAAATADLRAQCVDDTQQAIAAALQDLCAPVSVSVERSGSEPVVIEGCNPAMPEVLRWLSRGSKVYLVGPAGCGKTTIAEQCAQALSLPFFTTGQVLSEHQVMGFVDAAGNYHTTAFRHAFEHGGVWLADEIDSWSAEALLSANAALANGHATFPDCPHRVSVHPDFRVIAAANTFGTGATAEYVGRQPLDAATLDRFVCVPVTYDQALEQAIAGTQRAYLDLAWRVRAKCDDLRLQHVVSTRAVIEGCKALSDNEPFDHVVARLLRRNLDDGTWAKVSQ